MASQLPEMTTWRVLATIGVILSLLLVVAEIWRPADDLGGRTKLIWVSDNNPARTDQINTFNRENPQYKLELDPNSRGLEKVLLQCSSGVGPDVIDVYDGGELQTYVEAGVLADITDDANKLGFGLGSSWPTMAGEISVDGRQYSYPCNIGTMIIIYNKNVFDFYGVPYPSAVSTWDDLIKLAQRVSTGGTGRPGPNGPIFGISQLTWQEFFSSQHGEYFDAFGRLAILHNPLLKRAFEQHRDLIFKYHLSPTSIELASMSGQGGWGAASFTQFAANRFAMIVSGEYSLIAFGRDYHEQMDALKAAGKTMQDVTDPLARPMRLGSMRLPGPFCRLGARSAGINAYSHNRQGALAFLKYLAGPDYAAITNGAFDNLPGNNRYANLGFPTQSTDLDEIGLHQTSVQAMAFGYSKRKSPFLLEREVEEVLGGEISRLESDPTLDIDMLVQDAQRQLVRLLQRNLSHDPALKKLYLQSLADHPAGPEANVL